MSLPGFRSFEYKQRDFQRKNAEIIGRVFLVRQMCFTYMHYIVYTVSMSFSFRFLFFFSVYYSLALSLSLSLY